MKRLVFPGCAEPFPTELAPEVELVRYRTSDGLELTGAWVASPWPDARPALFFHGNRDSAPLNLPFARALASRGVSVFLAEYRGYGGMPGRPSERGLYADGLAAVEALRERAVDLAALTLVGRSLGTGVVVELAHRGHGRGLVLISPYTSIVDVARRRRGGFLAPLIIRDKFDSLSKVQAIAKPLVVFHGTADAVVPFEHGAQLVARAPMGRLVRLEDEVHRIDLTTLADPIAAAIRDDGR